MMDLVTWSKVIFRNTLMLILFNNLNILNGVLVMQYELVNY